ncbi:hypothetical protein PMIN01_12555 [Paraphaeosphaeria minitans]|uniref:Uncharacterized protein n=1 Tax=Paraphaeosphaeria minitans TaxID=565426 RepID=A0A9P6G6U3_9PLEO|nr:hypothetical protein PMIN01_12555 [Paraphaeosphaeria minitans]
MSTEAPTSAKRPVHPNGAMLRLRFRQAGLGELVGSTFHVESFEWMDVEQHQHQHQLARRTSRTSRSAAMVSCRMQYQMPPRERQSLLEQALYKCRPPAHPPTLTHSARHSSMHTPSSLQRTRPTRYHHSRRRTLLHVRFPLISEQPPIVRLRLQAHLLITRAPFDSLATSLRLNRLPLVTSLHNLQLATHKLTVPSSSAAHPRSSTAS